ncbi:MAG: hypothetical protein OSJ60_23580 [Lachnospiraceae bacterium]|nr:hypothetical protein [Lachnospiraceae bacterium]
MKKLVALVLTLVCALGLVGWLRSNSKNKDEVVSEDLPPILIMREQYFIAYDMPISELPDDFECMGEITEEEANGTGLQGCKYYANKYLSSFVEFYVYQECGTPVDENAVDSTKRQWAYVKWVREGFERE